MTSTASGKILPKRLKLTSEELKALDPLTRRFMLALSIIGDVEINDRDGSDGT